MTRVTVDFSDVQELEALPKGEYEAIIEKAEFRTFPEDPDKYDYINLEFTVTDGEKKGGKAWAVLSFSPKALWRMKQTFENLGLYMDELDIDVDDDTNQVTKPELVGLPVLIAGTQRVYEGRTQFQVESITSPDGVKKTPARGSRAKRPAPAGGGRKFK